MKPKDIFGLAVRILGLVFLYFGFRAVIPMLDLDFIENPDKTDLMNGFMPVVFNLALAWWLIRGGLTRWAYPERPKIPEPARPQSKPASPPSESVPHEPVSVPAQELSGMDQAEKKLAALVEKPK